MDQPKLILASASPRRRDFVSRLGISHQSAAAHLDESPLPDESPSDLALRLARAKAQTVALGLRETPSGSGEGDTLTPPGESSVIYVLGADTVVALGNMLLGKPGNADAARAMLKTLRNSSHQVYSAIALFCLADGEMSLIGSRLSQNRVFMRNYTDDEIEEYVAGGDPLDKAGAYAIQSRSFAPVRKLEGCASGVMGLSLADLVELLALARIRPLNPLIPCCRAGSGRACCQEEE